MDIVYIWTKPFKNLNGGYNLSSKYEINLSGNNVYLKTRKNYIEGFFDSESKINISAIIGENGSGKSSILKLVLKNIYASHSNKANNNESFAIFEANNCFYYSGDIPKTIEKDNVLQDSFRFKNEFFTLYFNYMFDSLKDSSHDEWIDKIYHKSDDYTMPLLLEPFKKNNIININNIDYLTRQRMILHKNSFEDNKLLTSIFSPIKVNLSLDTDKILKIYTTSNGGDYADRVKGAYKDYFKDLNKALSNLESINVSFSSIEKREFDSSDIRDFLERKTYSEKEKQEAYIKGLIYELPAKVINNLYIANKIDKYRRDNKNIKGKKPTFVVQKDKFDIEIKDSSHSTLKLRNALEYHNYILIDEGSESQLHDQKLNISNEKLNFLPSWFNVEFIDEKGSTFSSLSSGEKSLYTLMSTMIYQINNILSRQELNKGQYNNLLILLDETDLGLHPKWQREYIFNLIESIKAIKSNISVHFICTSHSPFIVSDLPKNNILFLRDGSECQLKNNELTFAENIHTLFNDSFFMKQDAMMGKFSESIIKEAFEFFEKTLKGRNKSEAIKKELKLNYIKKESYYKKIIEIVGDEYIRVAMINTIEEIELVFNLNSNKAKLEKLRQAIESNPDLYDKWLSEIE